MKIGKVFTFEAAHFLPNVPKSHKCGAVHGHSYTVEVVLEGDVDSDFGWVVDYDVISAAWQRNLYHLDHSMLNDTIENPTAETLATYIAVELVEALPLLSEVTVHETARTSATVKAPTWS